ncbi:hypothetical protein ABPG75_001727 [Micractinium tetrahymenae]
MLARATWCSWQAAPAPRSIAHHPHKPRPLPARGVSTLVDLGGDEHSAIRSAAASDDVLSYFTRIYMEGQSHKTKAKKLGPIMQTNLVTASPEDKLTDVEQKLQGIEGVPVVDGSGQLVGVMSRKDFKKGGDVVKDVMTKEVLALSPGDKVVTAAHMMVDNKVHRIPIVEDGKLVGIVTRTTLFWELASDNDRTEFFHQHGIDI